MRRRSLPIAPSDQRFRCLPGCGKCCEGPGYLSMTQPEARRIASHIGVSFDDWVDVLRFYDGTTKDSDVMKVYFEESCMFLDDKNGCAVHEVKPERCRTFPFWKNLVESRVMWRKAKSVCPGIGDSSGRLFSVEEIKSSMRRSM